MLAVEHANKREHANASTMDPARDQLESAGLQRTCHALSASPCCSVLQRCSDLLHNRPHNSSQNVTSDNASNNSRRLLQCCHPAQSNCAHEGIRQISVPSPMVKNKWVSFKLSRTILKSSPRSFGKKSRGFVSSVLSEVTSTCTPSLTQDSWREATIVDKFDKRDSSQPQIPWTRIGLSKENKT